MEANGRKFSRDFHPMHFSWARIDGNFQAFQGSMRALRPSEFNIIQYLESQVSKEHLPVARTGKQEKTIVDFSLLLPTSSETITFLSFAFTLKRAESN
jgi:hypothetical protein